LLILQHVVSMYHPHFGDEAFDFIFDQSEITRDVGAACVQNIRVPSKRTYLPALSTKSLENTGFR
jgi:hypothetical protein